MTDHIVVTVSPAGVVSARTEGMTGQRCLDYIEVLEDLLDAQTVESSYTAEYYQTTAAVQALPRVENTTNVYRP